MNQKIGEAIKYLGENWVLHERYNALANSHHSPKNKNAACLQQVRRKAITEGRLP